MRCAGNEGGCTVRMIADGVGRRRLADSAGEGV